MCCNSGPGALYCINLPPTATILIQHPVPRQDVANMANGRPPEGNPAFWRTAPGGQWKRVSNLAFYHVSHIYHIYHSPSKQGIPVFKPGVKFPNAGPGVTGGWNEKCTPEFLKRALKKIEVWLRANPNFDADQVNTHIHLPSLYFSLSHTRTHASHGRNTLRVCPGELKGVLALMLFRSGRRLCRSARTNTSTATRT